MKASRLIVLLTLPSALAACSNDSSNPTATGSEIVVTEVSLPVAGAAYHGADPHLFLDESVTLFCGSHGLFTNSVEPPSEAGTSVLSDYSATFVGELVLEPPVVSGAVTHALNVQARMVERITLSETRGSARVFDTELVTFELRGAGMPDGIMVRESPDLASEGVATITTVSGGMHRVESFYDVWLEISLDSGRSWHAAQNVVRMTLQPN